MRNIKLIIQYDGTRYSGWQFQRNARSVQGEAEKALKGLFGARIVLKGAGRTDAGVHALGQVANFMTRSALETYKIKKALNNTLPGDIVISDVMEAPLGFDSQHDSRAKIYRYTIVNNEALNPILRHYSSLVSYSLDLKKMRRAAEYLVGRHDFRAFQASGASKGDTRRTIKHIDIKKAGDIIIIEIEADGFLYNMVRSIIGTLVEVGRGKMAAERVSDILRSKDRRRAGPTAPAKGLCLMEVRY